MGIDADPVLTAGDADNFVRQEGLTDMRTKIANPGDGTQFTADPLSDAKHFRMRCAWISDPVDQEIPLLERWHERIAQHRPGRDTGKRDDRHAGVRRARCARGPGKHPNIDAPKPFGQGRYAARKRRIA